MGRVDRHDFESLSRHLSINIVETAEVCFYYRGRNRHSFNRIFLVTESGGGDNFIHNHDTGQRLPMTAGNLYFMPANADLQFSFNTDMHFISLHFHLELFRHFEVFSLHRSCESMVDARDCIAELQSIISAPYSLYSQCKLHSLIFQLAAEFQGKQDFQTAKLLELSQKYHRLFEYIADRADASTTIDDLTTIAGIPRDTLSREFSRDCGIPLKKYLMQYLIRRAETLLARPGATARAAAETLNFNNEYYFSRFFKQNTGRTPGEYRREMNRHA